MNYIMSPEEYDKIYDEGYNAANIDNANCPYDPIGDNERYKIWSSGYLDAKWDGIDQDVLDTND